MKEIGKKFRFTIALVAALLLLGLGLFYLIPSNKNTTEVAQQTAQQTELNIPPPEQVGELILVQEGDNAPVEKEAYLTINQWNELGVYGSLNPLIQGLRDKAANDDTAAEIWRQIQHDVLYGTADIFDVTLQLVTPDVTSKTTIKVVGGTPITTSEKQLTIADYVFKIENPNQGSDYAWLGWYGIPSDGKITGNVTITAKYGYFVDKPTASNTALTYTGGSQGPTITGYVSAKMTQTGTATATAVGSYKITFTPKENYAWTGGGIAPYEITWTISPMSLTIPTLSGTYTYSGSEQTATLSNVDTNTMSVTNNKRTNAGQQNITVALKDKTNYVWAGGSIDDQTISWTIKRATVSTLPSQSGTLTYNGDQQEPTWNNYDTNKMSIQGTTAAADAGPHTAAFLIGSNYQWSDGSTETKNVNWTIGTKSISGASVNLGTALTYNESSQTQSVTSVVIDGLNATYSVSNDSGTNAGNYTLTVTGTGNFSGTQEKQFTISKAAGSVTLSKTSGTVESCESITFSVTRAGDGAISVSSSATTTATVAMSGTTVTVTGFEAGSAVITVVVGEGTNYAPGQSTFTVNVPATLVYTSGSSSPKYFQLYTGGAYGYCYKITSGVMFLVVGYADAGIPENLKSKLAKTPAIETSKDLPSGHLLCLGAEIGGKSGWGESGGLCRIVDNMNAGMSASERMIYTMLGRVYGFIDLGSNKAGKSTVETVSVVKGHPFVMASNYGSTIDSQPFEMETYFAYENGCFYVPTRTSTASNIVSSGVPWSCGMGGYNVQGWWLRSGSPNSNSMALTVSTSGMLGTANVGDEYGWLRADLIWLG